MKYGLNIFINWLDTCISIMQQEKKLPSGSACMWREKYSKRFSERQSKIRDRHFGTKNNKILSAQSKLHDEIDVFLTNSESFKLLKPRLMTTPETDNRHALIYFMAADWCAGSLDYLMRENDKDGSEEVYSFEEEGYTKNKLVEENAHKEELTTFNKNSEDLDEETIEQVSARFEEHFTTMQKWLNTDVNDPSEVHRFQTGMNYALTKMGGCTRRIIAMKDATENDLTTMSTDELKELQIKIIKELKTRGDRCSNITLESVDTMFVIKSDGIREKKQEAEDIFDAYGPGKLSYCNDNEIGFCFQDIRDANDCRSDIERVKVQLKKNVN